MVTITAVNEMKLCLNCNWNQFYISNQIFKKIILNFIFSFLDQFGRKNVIIIKISCLYYLSVCMTNVCRCHQSLALTRDYKLALKKKLSVFTKR